MKIVIITAYFQPEFGYEEYFIARSYAKSGHDVSIVTSNMMYPFKNWKKLLADIGSEHTTRKRELGVSKLDGFTVYRLPFVVELFTDFNLIMNIGSTLKKLKPDIVHLHEPIQGSSAIAAQYKNLGFKLIVEQHGYATTFDERPTLKNKIAHKLFMYFRKPAGIYAFSRADAITAINVKAKEFMVKVQKIPEEKITVIPLGTDISEVNFNPKARKKLRKELGVSADTILILTAGRIDPAKKLEQLIDAFKKLNTKIDSKLAIIGSGDDNYAKKLRRHVDKTGLIKSVKFIKFIKKSLLPEYFSAADIGFWNKEAITIIEAMSCKLPVVLPDQAAVRHYITNDNGLFFRENDVAGLYDRLHELAIDKELRVRMGKRGRELVKKKFSYDVTAKRYLEIYKRLLDE